VDRTGEYFLVFFRTGDNFLGKDIGQKLDGRQIFVRKTGRATHFCPKNWTGDKNFFGGRATPKYRPSFYMGGGG